MLGVPGVGLDSLEEKKMLRSSNVSRGLLGLAAGGCVALAASADPVTIQNNSFETPLVDPGVGVSLVAPPWSLNGNGVLLFGVEPIGTGVFTNPSATSAGHLNNATPADGQIAYIFSNQSNSITQALVDPNTSSPITFGGGVSYTMTASVAQAQVPPSPTDRLAFELYWTDSSNVAHTVLDGVLTANNSTNFGSAALNQQSLVDYSFTSPTLAANDPAVGQQIDVGFFTLDNAPVTTSDPSTVNSGEFDIDNVRLVSSVPEPGTFTLIGGAASMLMLRRRRSCEK
jgi:hypothetical protein